MPTPNPTFSGVDFANLEGVSGVASDDVWAVGHGDDFATLRSRTLTEHWDGARWQIVPSPNPAGANNPNRLFAVLANAADDVWAVGEQGFPARALILHFDGNRWRTVPNSCGGGLHGITAVPGTSTAWAVGESTTCFFDGVRWTAVPQPGFPDLQDVSATSATDVWAVGFDVFCDPFACYFSSVIQRWDGAQWRDVTHPLATSLDGMQAMSGTDAWAVGTNSLGTRILHWDGAAWSDVPSPDPGDGGELTAVDAGPTNQLWSVGSFFDDRSDWRTLTIQAPSTSKGQVIGSGNLSGAVITWVGPVTGSTSADQFGDYDIPDLPAGTYLLTAADPFGGCDPLSARVRIAANQTTTQDFRLNC